MSRSSIAVVRVCAAVFLTVLFAGTPVAAQAPAERGADDWTPARTPWGDPDLQGIWNSKTQTPLERPDQYADREFLTDEEVAQLEGDAQTALQEGSGYYLRAERPERGTVLDVEGAYNSVFASRATKVVGTKRTSLIVEPPDGKVPYTAEALERRAEAADARRAMAGRADGPEDRSSDRCLGMTLPCTGALCAFSRLVQSPDSLTLYYEAGHWGGAYRTVWLDGRPHLPPHVRQRFGDSVGRWEGDTLVVDTTNFTNENSFQGSGEDMHLVEQFERIEPDLMVYRATVEDETAFSQPWTLEMTWSVTDNQDNLIFESACHEGNYALTSILAGARAEEKATASTKER